MPFLIALISACALILVRMKDKIINLQKRISEFFSFEEQDENAPTRL